MSETEVKFWAFDTETVNRPSHGEACLLLKASSKGADYEDFPQTFDEIYKFLCEDRRNNYVCWNMDFDARAIIHPKFLPFSCVEKLGISGHSSHGSYYFKYIPSKFLEIKGSKGTIALYDLSQFYGMSLRRAAEKYLPSENQKHEIPPEWYNEMDLALCDERRPRIIEYGFSDIKSCQALADKLLSSIRRLGINPSRLSSCASLARAKYGPILESERPPIYYNKIFERSYYGGRIEPKMLGNIGPCRLWDIHSAYPAIIHKLRSLKNASTLSYNRSMGKWKDKGADYGHYEILAQIPRFWKWGPFAYRNRNKILFPVGNIHTFCSRPGINWLLSKSIPFEVLYAEEIFINPKAAIIFPDMPQMFASRKDESIGLAVKLAINSLYGLMAERSTALIEDPCGEREINFQKYKNLNRYGKCTNFIYAAHVTESVRLQTFDVVSKYPNDCYFIATDGILTSPKVNLPTGPNMGQWGLKGEYKKGVILGCGRYLLEHEDPKQTEYHLRGFPVNLKTFNRISKCQKQSLAIPCLSTGTLREWALNPAADLNVLMEIPKTLKVQDQKRTWVGSFTSLADTFVNKIDSLPYIGVDEEPPQWQKTKKVKKSKKSPQSKKSSSPTGRKSLTVYHSKSRK